jgi:hypothetical protein
MKREVTGTVIVTVDYIWRNGVNHWQFLHFLKEVGSECNDFICSSVARWLTRGAVLITLQFFLISRTVTDSFMKNESWISQLFEQNNLS